MGFRLLRFLLDFHFGWKMPQAPPAARLFLSPLIDEFREARLRKIHGAALEEMHLRELIGAEAVQAGRSVQISALLGIFSDHRSSLEMRLDAAHFLLAWTPKTFMLRAWSALLSRRSDHSFKIALVCLLGDIGDETAIPLLIKLHRIDSLAPLSAQSMQLVVARASAQGPRAAESAVRSLTRSIRRYRRPDRIAFAARSLLSTERARAAKDLLPQTIRTMVWTFTRAKLGHGVLSELLDQLERLDRRETIEVLDRAYSGLPAVLCYPAALALGRLRNAPMVTIGAADIEMAGTPDDWRNWRILMGI